MNEHRDTLASAGGYLITGGAGFIGSHLADKLLASGNTVVALDDFSTGRPSNVAHLASSRGFSLVQGSVMDTTLLDRLMAKTHTVVHLAAAVGVELIVKNPAYVIEANVGGTQSVLRAAARHGRKVLLASTSEVYGKSQDIPFNEDGDCVLGATSKPRWSYAASKAVDEFLGFAFYRQSNLPVVIFRLFNTVGPRQSGQYGMVVPRFVEWALTGQKIRVYGDGQQTRCFCDVRDVVRAIELLSQEPGAVGRVFNIGTQGEVSILDLARRVLVLTGRAADEREADTMIEFVPYEQAYGPDFEDMRRRVPDISRIKAATGWAPSIELDKTLLAVISERSAGLAGRAAGSSASSMSSAGSDGLWYLGLR